MTLNPREAPKIMSQAFLKAFYLSGMIRGGGSSPRVRKADSESRRVTTTDNYNTHSGQVEDQWPEVR